MSKKYNKLLNAAKGIKIDVGCGLQKQKGFVGLDVVKHPCVDIVHDVQKFPWPVPASCCHQIVMSHLWEHIEPKYRFRLMDELWRIIRHDGQLFISAPYAHTFLAAAHPAHYECPNEATFTFFDPDYFLYRVCAYKKPKPWKILHLLWDMHGCIEIILEPRKNNKGRAIMPASDGVQVQDVVQVALTDKSDKEREKRKPANKTSDRNSNARSGKD